MVHALILKKTLTKWYASCITTTPMVVLAQKEKHLNKMQHRGAFKLVI